MSNNWGDKIDQDYEIPRSGKQRRRAFNEEDTIEVLVHQDHDLQAESRIEASPRTVHGESEDELHDEPSRIPRSVLTKLLPTALVLIVGVLLGSTFTANAPEKVCTAFKGLDEDVLGNLQSVAEDDGNLAALFNELNQACATADQEKAETEQTKDGLSHRDG